MIDDEAIAIIFPRTDRVRYPDEAIINGQQQKGAPDGTQSSILLVSWTLLLVERKYEDQTRAAGRSRFPFATDSWAMQAIQAIQQHRACHSQHIVCIVDSRGVASGPRGSRVFHGVPARSCPLAPCKKVPKVPASGGAAEEATR